MTSNSIRVVGARVHNLKNITVEIPRDKFVVITGLSGSGKSSLAFDTIFAEGQRRYVESLSAYARQFIGQMDKPDVDYIEGLSPAVSIDQKSTSHNPRSTVGTVTEIYDYMRLLFARAGIPTNPVYALDLAFFLPLCAIAGVGLLRQNGAAAIAFSMLEVSRRETLLLRFRRGVCCVLSMARARPSSAICADTCT